MRLSVRTLRELDEAISENIRSDYIYMYPPRQIYSQFSSDLPENKSLYIDNLSRALRSNLYIHFPFCNQICGFCNLYTTNIRDVGVHEEYVDSLIKHIEFVARFNSSSVIPTIYFGGGTPTILSIDLLNRVLVKVLKLYPNVSDDCEIAIEVDPQTVDHAYLTSLKQIGFNRINLGLQTSDNSELKTIGRRYRRDEQDRISRKALEVGFENVCCDLIYGLPGQSASSWSASVEECLELNPNTICCYPLTERPFTGFSKSGRERSPDSDYDMWEFADQRIRQAGFERQTHVRWARDGGGYRQKELHWGMESLVGIGAGARSYLWDIDTRAHYSIVDRTRALDAYLVDIKLGKFIPSEGFLMSTEERLRKAVILGIHSLDFTKVAERVGLDPREFFKVEFTGLSERGLVSLGDKFIRLTDAGHKYRDLIVQLFFSDEVREATQSFSYVE